MQKDTRLVLWVNGSSNVIIGAPANFKPSESSNKLGYENQLKVYTGKVLQAVEMKRKKRKPKQSGQIYYLENSKKYQEASKSRDLVALDYNQTQNIQTFSFSEDPNDKTSLVIYDPEKSLSSESL